MSLLCWLPLARCAAGSVRRSGWRNSASRLTSPTPYRFCRESAAAGLGVFNLREDVRCTHTAVCRLRCLYLVGGRAGVSFIKAHGALYTPAIGATPTYFFFSIFRSALTTEVYLVYSHCHRGRRGDVSDPHLPCKTYLTVIYESL